MNSNLRIISAGAGSGKTYRLMSEMVDLLKSKTVQPEGIIATTFTKKAAVELEERVRVKLLSEGMPDLADRLTGALIGTVHGLGVKLLKRFAFEAGVSPNVDIIADEDQKIFFNQSLATILTEETVNRMESLCEVMQLKSNDPFNRYDWRDDVRTIVDIARANGFDIQRLEESKKKSYESLVSFFHKESKKDGDFLNKKLKTLLEETVQGLKDNTEDSTKKTISVRESLEKYLGKLDKKGSLNWYDWLGISLVAPGKKSSDIVEELKEFCSEHDANPQMRKDVKDFINQIFDISIGAINEYKNFKQKRGLIDYLDMETQVKKLLDNPSVHAVLSEEIELLMVDEFQDTSPIQLEIFYKLSQMANHSIWVGDPKQSIYGFRGAEPELMLEIIRQTGGVKPDDIQRNSWRSREDVVFATNTIFCKAFPELPEEQVALIPKRRNKATSDSSNKTNEPLEVDTALQHWHFNHEGGGKTPPKKPWMERCIASNIRDYIERKPYVNIKGEEGFRPVRAGDIAILCRSNKECLAMADALHHQGMKAAISRNGLVNTPEAKLILSCLKYLLHQHDSLSVGEIMLLADAKSLEDIVDSRLKWIEEAENEERQSQNWEEDNPFIKRLNELRPQITELSGSEILNLILEDLDLRRIICRWGNPAQRYDNIDMLRKYADQYEDACNRLHSGASLAGFLLWLSDLAANENDAQGSSEQHDAVNVLTYHKSKGLEWPVVIVHSLEAKLRDNLWGAQVHSYSNKVDLENLSADRYIRYWRHPYSKRYLKSYMYDQLSQHEIKIESERKAVAEDSRVMYVGITRARDYLIFATRNKPTLWLNRTWHGAANELTPTLDSNSYESPWTWKDKALPIISMAQEFPRLLEHHPREESRISLQSKREGICDSHIPFIIDTEKEQLHHFYKIQVTNSETYTSPFRFFEAVSPYTISNTINAFIQFDNIEYDELFRWEAAQRITNKFGISEDVPAKDISIHGMAFTQFIHDNFSPNIIYKSYPIRFEKQERRFDTEIDFLIINENNITAIHTSHFTGDANKWKNKIRESGNWYYLTLLALQEQFPDKKIDLKCHFLMKGVLVDVEVKIKKVELV